MGAPRKGGVGTYQVRPTDKPLTFTVIRVEGNICHCHYHGDAAPSLFIWRFKDGLSQFHHWLGKDNELCLSRKVAES